MPTKVATQKRLASRILKCGLSKVWIDPEAVDEVGTAMTAGDVRKYIGLGFIKKLPYIGNSRGRIRHINAQKKKGRRKGHGSRKGAKYARLRRKERWIISIRAGRKCLRELKEKGMIERKTYRLMYRKLKPGTFKNKQYILAYLKEQGLISKYKPAGKKK